MAVASHYGLTLADVASLKLWEMNYLIEEMEDKSSSRGGSKYPPGSIPVMT